MRCHYDVLEIQRDANDDQIKKAYRKLALKWHPDKNPDRIEECTQYFALIQQANEVLSDPHERAFYDRYRENILRGGADGDLKDEGVDLFGYFTSTCYSGFGDDEKGFYSVYRRIFEKLAEEDYEYIIDPKDKCYPSFGNSQSDYESDISDFYGFWQDFSTCRSFVWLDEHDLRQAPNAKYVKAMEKENKKLRDVGRKQRNEQIRELVQFVRKRDKRVSAYRQVLEERRKEQEKKAEEARQRQIRQRLEEFQNYKENDKHKEDHLQDLREIEEALDAEYGDSQAQDSDENEILDPEDDLFCVACDKSFKNLKSKLNHDKSKKHKDNIALLRKHMLEEDAELLFENSMKIAEEPDEEEPQPTGGKKSKKQKKKDKRRAMEAEDDQEEVVVPECSDSLSVEDPTISALVRETESIDIASDNAQKKPRRRKGAAKTEDQEGPKEATCDGCKEKFDSRTHLFAHLKETGHATLKSGAQTKKGKKK